MRTRALSAAWIGIAPLAFGCNAILGFHPAADGEWDGGALNGAAGDDGSASSTSSALTSDGASTVPFDAAGADAGAVTRWAQWPMPNPPATTLNYPQNYDTSIAGIVLDTVTKLQWQAATDGKLRTWPDALTYCAGLVLSPTTGAGWRLPSRIELISIWDYTQPVLPAIGPSFLPLPNDGGALTFWTASAQAGDPRNAWTVNFGWATFPIVNQALSTPLFVRCVRGPTP